MRWCWILAITLGCASCKEATIVDCTKAKEGTVCVPTDRTASAEDRYICVAGSCAKSACGDAYVDTIGGEECEQANGVEKDGCEPETCKYSCSDDAACDDGLVCNGTESCDPALHRCVRGALAANETDCVLPESNAPGLCKSGACVYKYCELNGSQEGMEECDDGNTTSGDGCEDDCTWSCGSEYRRDRECGPTTCGTLGSNQIEKRQVCQLDGHVCREEIATCDNSLLNAPYNGCTRVDCIDRIGCAYVPYYKSKPELSVPDTPHLLANGGLSAKMRNWLTTQKRDCEASDPACSIGTQPTIPYGSEQPSQSRPYCQVLGDVDDASKRICYNSFDYDCSGSFDWQAAQCTFLGGDAFQKVDGWIQANESLCGQAKPYWDYDDQSLTCDYTTVERAVECR